jgi:enamine deaminase RidA (YjgF/YER057c/UK114 family)
VRAGSRLFVAGHDPERGGRLAYRGRVGRSVSAREARAALRLATQNALASARSVAGPLARFRCVVVTAFVASARPEGLDPSLLEECLALLAAVLPAGPPPAVRLMAAQGLSGGMPVEVELVLEVRTHGARPRSGARPRRHSQ